MAFNTTQDDFEIFTKTVQQWAEFFGLKSYELHFRHNDKHLGSLAALEAETGSRNAVFTLKKSKWPIQATKYDLEKCAFHEVVELLLHEAREWAEARTPSGSWEDVNHKIIRTLENSVFEKFRSQ